MPAVENIHEVGVFIFFRADDTLIILFFLLYHGVGALYEIIDYDFVDFGVFGVAAVFAVVVDVFYGLVGGDESERQSKCVDYHQVNKLQNPLPLHTQIPIKLSPNPQRSIKPYRHAYQKIESADVNLEVF
jgi:hypothetical protein